MEVVKVFAQFGVPTMVLGFVLWFLLKPLVHVLIKNIEVQTDALGKITKNLSDVSNKMESMESDINLIKNKLA